MVTIPDDDDDGRARSRRVVRTVHGAAASVKVLELPGLRRKGADVSDWLDAGHTADELERLAAEAPILDSRFADIGNRENPENRATGRFSLTRLGDLLAEPEQETDWLVDQMLPAGGLSILGAKPKVGKTTLARNLSLETARGDPFLGRATAQGGVVYLALEEKRSEVAKHFARMGATEEDIYIHVGSAPEEALEALRDAIAEHRPRLAIVDPILKLIRLRDANDYAEVSRALEPLIDLARASGCHILCVHHLGKGERTGGDAILGSTALFGAVDAALLMKRRDAVRTIETIQRYGEDLPETVVALDPETGVVSAAGEVEAIQLRDAGEAVMEAIGDEALAEADIKERVGGNQTVTAKAVRALADDGRLVRTGAGRRGDPYLYRAVLEQEVRPAGVERTHTAAPGEAPDSRFSRLPHRENRANRETGEPDAPEYEEAVV